MKLYIGKNNTCVCLKCLPSVFPFTHVSTENLKLHFQGKKTSSPDDSDLDIPDIRNTLLENPSGTSSDSSLPIILPDCKYYTPSELNNQNFRSCKFSLAHLNISSVSHHFDDLQSLLSTLEPTFDVIGISECRIKISNPP